MSAPDEMPLGVRALERNKAGYPIPWFVDRAADVAGQPDFRIMDGRRWRDAVRFSLCWVCGRKRGVYGAFVVGPMCAVNRTSAEPPCHLDCAIYSATHCPFLITPSMVRRDKHLPEHAADPGGVMCKRNPGVALVYVSRTFRHYRVENGNLFDMGAPEAMRWFARGRAATQAEIIESIQTGFPTLMDMAEAEGSAAIAELSARVNGVLTSIEGMA